MTSLKLKVRVFVCVCFAANTESYTVYVAGARRNIEDRSSTHHNSKGIRWLASGWVQKNIFKNRRCAWLRAVTVGRGCWLSWNHSHCVTRACWACVYWCKWVLERNHNPLSFKKLSQVLCVLDHLLILVCSRVWGRLWRKSDLLWCPQEIISVWH